jgi:hypothetical protein
MKSNRVTLRAATCCEVLKDAYVLLLMGWTGCFPGTAG